MTQTAHPDSILIIDFGSQVTQLIARRVREAGVYCEIHPFQNAADAFEKMQPKGVIFSAGPASVTAEGSPRAPQAVFDAGIPILGICYGQQTLCTQLGGTVEGGHAAEFGRADIEIKKASTLFDGFWELKLHPWDTAAGTVIVQDAGGKVTDFAGRKYSIYDKYILASNVHLHGRMKKVLAS